MLSLEAYKRQQLQVKVLSANFRIWTFFLGTLQRKQSMLNTQGQLCAVNFHILLTCLPTTFEKKQAWRLWKLKEAEERSFIRFVLSIWNTNNNRDSVVHKPQSWRLEIWKKPQMNGLEVVFWTSDCTRHFLCWLLIIISTFLDSSCGQVWWALYVMTVWLPDTDLMCFTLTVAG